MSILRSQYEIKLSNETAVLICYEKYKNFCIIQHQILLLHKSKGSKECSVTVQISLNATSYNFSYHIRIEIHLWRFPKHLLH